MSSQDKPANVSAGLREQQQARFVTKEHELRDLALRGDDGEFFRQIVPLLGRLRSYVRRRLRVARLSGDLINPTVGANDIVDDVIVDAYQHIKEKPSNFSLEQWLFQLASKKLDEVVRADQSRTGHRYSVETIRNKELSTLDEQMTADAEGEPYLVEELDDSEYQEADLQLPAQAETPEDILSRRELIRRIVSALSQLPPKEHAVFELFMIERFPKEAVASIAGVRPDEVVPIAERVKQRLREVIGRVTQDRKAS
jgi:RNA polymerase sigma factor (sigma-70 family)